MSRAALGIALLGSIATAVYRDRLSTGVHADPAARATVGGAVQSARQLPDRVGDDVLSAARDAFTQGLHVAAIAGALLAVVLAVLVVQVLHRRPGEPSVRPAPCEPSPAA